MKSFVLIFSFFISGHLFSQNFDNLAIGEKASDFNISTIEGKEIQLKEINRNNPVVLVVLRGWPGYQCPVCTRQVGSLLAEADKFAELGAVVLMVYPGLSEQLVEHAREFSEDFKFPDNFYFTLDPEYTMIDNYGLRWDVPKETAYPSTFVINKQGIIMYSKISTTHGGRADTGDLLEVLGKL